LIGFLLQRRSQKGPHILVQIFNISKIRTTIYSEKHPMSMLMNLFTKVFAGGLLGLLAGFLGLYGWGRHTNKHHEWPDAV